MRKRQKQYVSEELKTQKYWEKRKKNNNAARRSREAKRLRENQVPSILTMNSNLAVELTNTVPQILLRARFLEEENAKLRQEVRRHQSEKMNMQQTIQNLNLQLDSGFEPVPLNSVLLNRNGRS